MFYANYRHIEVVDLKIEMERLKRDVVVVETFHKSEMARMKKELDESEKAYQNLLKEFEDFKAQNEITDEKIICDYITTNYKRTPPSVAKEISKAIIEVSKEKQVAAPLLIGIAEVESNFNPFAVSKVGARGLMQVMPEWVGKLPTELQDKFELHDIEIGIKSGVDVFKIHLDENEGNVNKALYHYVNKDKSYVLKVYTAVGKYLAFTRGK
jgi:soluble lytic murein transglycosylase-like protein